MVARIELSSKELMDGGAAAVVQENRQKGASAGAVNVTGKRKMWRGFSQWIEEMMRLAGEYSETLASIFEWGSSRLGDALAGTQLKEPATERN